MKMIQSRMVGEIKITMTIETVKPELGGRMLARKRRNTSSDLIPMPQLFLKVTNWRQVCGGRLVVAF